MVVGIHDESAQKLSQCLAIAIGMIHDFQELVWRWIDLNSRILRTGHFVAMDIPIVPLVTTMIQTSNEADSERSDQMLSNAYLWLWLVRAGSNIWFGLQFGNCCLSGRQDVSSLSVASTMSSKSSDSVSKRISWQLSCGFQGLSIFYVLQKLSSKEKITILVFRQKLFFYEKKWKSPKVTLRRKKSSFRPYKQRF